MATEWPTFERPPAVAFLDVDGTLLAETTTYLFARILPPARADPAVVLPPCTVPWPPAQARPARLWTQLVAFGLRNIASIPVDELERIAYENFVENVRPRLYVGVVDHLNDLRMRGTEVVLVSSSPQIVLQPLSIFLGCTDTLTTPVRIERGRLIGVADGPPCYGEGKLHRAAEWARDRGIAMDEAAAYADNWSDRALLGRVGRAVVVHPHRKLRRLALERGWTVVHPRRPGPSRVAIRGFGSREIRRPRRTICDRESYHEGNGIDGMTPRSEPGLSPGREAEDR